MLQKIIYLVCFILLVSGKPKLTLGAGGFGFGCGSNSPAAQVPYSYVRLGPDTAPLLKKEYLSFNHFGGYSDNDHYIRAFSHMHLVGAGVIDMGIFGVLPKKADKKPTIPDDIELILYKDLEYAEPGYYKVDIEYNITAELTTTQRTGAHRYTFHTKGPHQINVMTGYLLDKKGKRNSTTSICGQKCLQGAILVQSGFGGRFGGYTVYYHMIWVSEGSDQVSIFNDNSIDSKATTASGIKTGGIITTNSTRFEIYIGISYVSMKNAKLNLEKQVGSKLFDQIKSESQQIWKNQLKRFQISAISPDYQTKIDTAIYRTFLSPTLFNDVNREYMSFKNDGSISLVPQDMQAVYTDMSIWDVHRTQMPWLLFQDLKRFNDIAKSLVLINREGGYMPKWPFAQGWTGCMIGAHANTILADWIVKQAHKKKLANITQILSYMLRNANTNTPHDNRPIIDFYLKNGYINYEDEKRSSVSETLQLSFNDFGISKVAELLNMTEQAKDFRNRSKFYKNVWNNQTKFFDPKLKNGSFVPISNKERINIFSNYYVQGDAWHYRFAIPHDAQGLIQLFGGKQPFVKQLTKFFKLSRYWPTFWLLNPYYWAGNQHDLFSVWLFSYANRRDLTCKFSRMIMNEQYGVQGDGLPGNDDYATMSAWFIFASFGFYPLPSTQTYILGSPVIHSARIYRRMQDGTLKPFNIRVQGNSESKYLVQSISINEKILGNFVTHSELDVWNSMLTFAMKM